MDDIGREICSKFVKGMISGGNKDGMYVNEYLYKCLYYKIYFGK